MKKGSEKEFFDVNFQWCGRKHKQNKLGLLITLVSIWHSRDVEESIPTSTIALR